jgi:hypothetical protein
VAGLIDVMAVPAMSFDQPRLPDHEPALIESIPNRLKIPATSTRVVAALISCVSLA